MKKPLFFAGIVLAAAFFTQCQSGKIQLLVREMNKAFPYSQSGITIEKAEAVDANTVKLKCTLEGELFEGIIDDAYWEKFTPAMKTSAVIMLQSKPDICDRLIKFNATLIYDFQTTTGKHLFDFEITPDDLKQETDVSIVGDGGQIDIKAVREEMVNSIRPQLPIMVSEADEMSIVDIGIENENGVVYTYEIPRENLVSEKPYEVKATLIETLKNTPSFVEVIHSGLEVRYIYKDKTTKKQIVECKITKEDF
jgi:hypothetical protein